MKNNQPITIEDVKRLNADRTQGEWLAVYTASDSITALNPGRGLVHGPVIINYDKSVFYLPVDAQFIAASPAIAQLCIEQGEEIERLRIALEKIANHSHPSDRNPYAIQNIAHQAITPTEKGE